MPEEVATSGGEQALGAFGHEADFSLHLVTEDLQRAKAMLAYVLRRAEDHGIFREIVQVQRNQLVLIRDIARIVSYAASSGLLETASSEPDETATGQ